MSLILHAQNARPFILPVIYDVMSHNQPMMIIELKAHETTLCKDLRLRALTDSPGAFGESLSEAEDRPDDYWRRVVKSLTPPNRQRMFIAFDHGTYCGSTFATLDKQDERTGRIGGMWVDSVYRRRGIGRALLMEVFSWARNLEFDRLKLWAIDEPQSSKLFYEYAGFRETLNRDTSHSKIEKDIVEMVYDLRAL